MPAFLALGCVGLAFTGSAARAADEPRDDATGPAAPASEEERARREEILVNGTLPTSEGYHADHSASLKFTAPLLDTPRSVTVIPAQVLRDTASSSLTEALRTVPGITMGAGEGGSPLGDRPFIRGYDTQSSTFVDGVRDIAAQSRETFDVDRIEVIKGSSGAFGGRGSPGGSINLISKLPTDTNSLEVTGAGGNADYKRFTGDANYVLSDMVSARVAAVYHDQGIAGRDWVKAKRWGVAPSVTIGLGTPTRMTLSYYHLESDDNPDSGIPYLYTTTNAPAGVTETRPIKDFTTIGGQQVSRSRSAFYGLADRDFRHTDTNNATMRVEHDFGGGVMLRNTARYGHTVQNYIYTQPDDSQNDVFGTSATGTTPSAQGGYIWRRANNRFGTTEGLLDQTDLTGSFTLFGMSNSFAMGTEFSWENARYGNYELASGSTLTPRCTTASLARYYCTSAGSPNYADPFVNYTSDTSGVATPIVKGATSSMTIADVRTQAAYAFDTLTVTDWLMLSAGARFDDYHTRVRSPVVNGVRPETSRHDRLWTGQAGVVVKPTEHTSLYASYASAATPPGSYLGQGSDTNGAVAGRGETITGQDDLKVEKTKSYEAGAKADLFENHLSLTAAAFETKTNNTRAIGEAGTVQYVGTRRIRGFELGFNGAVLPGWNVFGGYTHLNARITDGGFTATTGTVAGRTVTVIAPSVNTGKRFPNTPRDSFTLFTTYQVTPRLMVGGGTIYMGKVYGGYGDTRTINSAGQLVITKPIARYVPSYWRFDANAAYDLTKHLELRLNVLNLTNKLYYDQAFASHYANQAPGRTVIGTLAIKY